MNYPYNGGGREMYLNHKGFSLLEILIGMVILAIGILAIAGMQITSIRGNFFSDNIMQASILGQDRLEELKAIPLNPDTAAGIFNIENIVPFDDGVFDRRGTNFSRTYVVEAHPILTGSIIIRVIVVWTDTSDHNISFSTVKSPTP